MNKWIATLVVWLCFGFFSLPAMAADAEINCKPTTPTFDSKESNKNKNSRNPKELMAWKVEALDFTVLKIEFVKKGTALGESPFNDGLDFFYLLVKKDGDKVEWGPIKDHVPGAPAKLYNYRITCIMPDQSEKWIDPIIEVPRSNIVVPPAETQTQTKE